MAEGEKKCPKCVPGSPAWMNTYGDMVTLLLTFFVALMGIQAPPGQQIQLILSAFDGSLNKLEGGSTLTPGVLVEMGSTVESLPSNTYGKGLAKEIQKISDLLKPEIKSTKVRIDETTKGYKITLASDFFFRPASAQIDYEEGVEILRKVAFALLDSPINSRLEVIGHTDRGAIIPGSALAQRFPSNWELSTGRASTIVRYLIDFGLDPKRFYAEGRAEFEPIESNDTPEGRAYNRRVEIYVSVDRDR
ncbi:chemotaxis protein MotB [Brevinema andersonii]|uniref:Chemotaxis protein MotB n=1 Tax=Brevinema andersonii TaxID=34097 RepID=A0A1I1E5Y2_BREAD|nr:OmpA family protein [Brevinema andersonii]SFB80320.1 chemotaxis protein MotB [Brevinema andersonii]